MTSKKWDMRDKVRTKQNMIKFFSPVFDFTQSLKYCYL